eukprot:986324_1
MAEKARNTDHAEGKETAPSFEWLPRCSARHSSQQAHLVVHGQLVALRPLRVFLQKRIEDVGVLIELRFQGLFACCNVFSLDFLRTEYSAAEQSDDSKLAALRNIAAGIAETADKIHLNSFLYDFHLRHFFSFLTDNDADYPPMDLVASLRALTRFYLSPPKFTRSALVSQSVYIPVPFVVGVDMETVWNFVRVKSARYLMCNVDHRDNTSCVFTVSSTGKFSLAGGPISVRNALSEMSPEHAHIQSPKSTHHIRYVIVVPELSAQCISRTATRDSLPQKRQFIDVEYSRMAARQRNSLCLEFFLMRVDLSNSSPRDKSHFSCSEWAKIEADIKQVEDHAKMFLRSVFSRAFVDCHLPSLWGKIFSFGFLGDSLSDRSSSALHLSSSVPATQFADRRRKRSLPCLAPPYFSADSGFPLTQEQFQDLMELSPGRPVEELDASLKDIVKALNGVPNVWYRLFEHLRKCFPGSCFQLRMKDSAYLLVIDSHSQDHFLILSADFECQNRIQVVSFCRTADMFFTMFEKSLVSRCINAILVFLFENCR